MISKKDYVINFSIGCASLSQSSPSLFLSLSSFWGCIYFQDVFIAVVFIYEADFIYEAAFSFWVLLIFAIVFNFWVISILGQKFGVLLILSVSLFHYKLRIYYNHRDIMLSLYIPWNANVLLQIPREVKLLNLPIHIGGIIGR